MGLPLISIIVPVYNVEDYLADCIDSILGQTYENIEIILVDDGSTDGSGSLCDILATRDKRIIVYHKTNGGLSDARNYGIDRLHGDYLTFIDSDDYVDKKYIETLYDMVSKYDVLISVLGIGSGISECAQECPYERFLIDKKEALKHMLIKEGFGVSACAKLFSREVFINRRFPKGYLYEDLFTIPYIIMEADKIVYSKEPLYFYRQRMDSIMHRSLTDKDYIVLEGQSRLYDYTINHYPDLEDAAACRFADDLIMVLFQRMVFMDNYIELINDLKKKYSSIINCAIKSKYLRRNRKIQLILIKISPRLYKLVYTLNLKNKKE